MSKNCKTGAVYVALRQDGLVKIGITSYPERRKKELENGSGFKIEKFFNSDIYSNANKIESLVHKTLSDQRKQGEWFDCNFDEAVKEVEIQSNLIGKIDDEEGDERGTEGEDIILNSLREYRKLLHDMGILMEKINMANELCHDMLEWVETHENSISKLLNVLNKLLPDNEETDLLTNKIKSKLVGVDHCREALAFYSEYGVKELESLKVSHDEEGIQKVSY